MRSIAKVFLSSPLFTENTPFNIRRLLMAMRYASLPLRKFIVGACRLQRPIFVNSHLTEEFFDIPDLERRIQIEEESQVLDEVEIVATLNDTFKSIFWTSLVAYVARVERPVNASEFLLQKHLGAVKELRAAVHEDADQQLNYTALFTSDPTVRISEHCPHDHNRLVQIWNEGIQKLPSYFIDRVVYPHYNCHKNVSHATSGFYAERTGLSNNNLDTTTWDLLEHYHRTGEKIQGPMEFRIGWKLNDLKPRGYYCNGGTGYFSSEYIKPICNFLQDILPCTNVYTRYDTSRLSVDAISAEEFLITYDYSSFTSSLSELKYFLAYLGNSLTGVNMTVLDVYQGLIEIDVGEYILDYNTQINTMSDISLHRVIDEDHHGVDDMPVDPTDASVYMVRNGPLGVAGNIGFSTNLHGISLSAFTDRPDRDSCVGDDALTRLLKILFGPFVQHTNKLGFINTTKFATLETDFYNLDISAQQTYRYLKRPLTLDYFGRIETGILLDFPGLAEILHFLDPDTLRDITDKPLSDLAKAFSTQVARMLTKLTKQCEKMSDPEQLGLLAIFRRAYSLLGLPVGGCMPNTRTYSHRLLKNQLIPYVVPGVEDIELFEQGWEYLLCLQFVDSKFTTELKSETRTVDHFYGKGSSFRGTSSPALDILENAKYVTRENIIIERTVGVDFWEEELITLLLSDQFVVFEYTQITESIPSWYNDIVDLEFYHPLHNY